MSDDTNDLLDDLDDDDPSQWNDDVPGQPAGYVPPKEWLWQCNACGARNQSPQGRCWHCGSNLSNEPQVGGGRRTTCWNCGKAVLEANNGDLDDGGVICPFRGAHLVSP